MKNLQRNYSKVFIQQNQCIITNYYNGFEVHIYQNQIGFTNEIREQDNSHYMCNFYNINHNAVVFNYKLYKKYPVHVLKQNYKKWLKMKF